MIHAKYKYGFKSFSEKEVDMKTNSTALLLQVHENMQALEVVPKLTGKDARIA